MWFVCVQAVARPGATHITEAACNEDRGYDRCRTNNIFKGYMLPFIIKALTYHFEEKTAISWQQNCGY